MFIPESAVSIKDQVFQQIRLLLQGYGGTGKTYSALTFPNVIVANIDRGLTAHLGKDIPEFKLYEPAFVDARSKRVFATAPPNRRDAFLHLMRNDFPKLQQDQTLLEDSWTSLQNAFDQQTSLEPSFSTTGKEDKYVFWKRKMDFSLEVVEGNKSLNCHVIVTCHEQADRNDDGNLNGKLKPLMQGQFADQLLGHFTDVFRQLAISKPTDVSKVNLSDYGCKTVADFQALMNSFTTNTMYLWQTQSDSVVNCKTALVGAPKFIKADFDTYNKYRRKAV